MQQVLDTALAWAVINNHFEIADFLLAHGADINTNWSSHEPASILHELVWHKNYEAMQFLIDRGIDMTIVDYRWGATAQGWAAVRCEGREDGAVAARGATTLARTPDLPELTACIWGRDVMEPQGHAAVGGVLCLGKVLCLGNTQA